jgi:hypothetical protein
MAPGYEDAQALAASKAATDYWARSATEPKKSAA